jgi:hypothetical protein
MSHLINKLLGKDETQSHSNGIQSSSVTGSPKDDSKTTNTSAGGQVITEGRTVQHGGVNIKSTISSDAKSTVSMANQQKLNDLVSKLG